MDHPERRRLHKHLVKVASSPNGDGAELREALAEVAAAWPTAANKVAGHDTCNDCDDVSCNNSSSVSESDAFDINVLNTSGKSLLHLACWRGSEANVEVLLAHRADPNLVSRGLRNYGKTAVFYALTRGRDTLVRQLIAPPHCIDVRVVNNKGQSVLSLAAAHLPMATVRAIFDAERKGGSQRRRSDWRVYHETHHDGCNDYGDLDARFARTANTSAAAATDDAADDDDDSFQVPIDAPLSPRIFLRQTTPALRQAKARKYQEAQRQRQIDANKRKQLRSSAAPATRAAKARAAMDGFLRGISRRLENAISEFAQHQREATPVPQGAARTCSMVESDTLHALQAVLGPIIRETVLGLRQRAVATKDRSFNQHLESIPALYADAIDAALRRPSSDASSGHPSRSPPTLKQKASIWAGACTSLRFAAAPLLHPEIEALQTFLASRAEADARTPSHSSFAPSRIVRLVRKATERTLKLLRSRFGDIAWPSLSTLLRDCDGIIDLQTYMATVATSDRAGKSSQGPTCHSPSSLDATEATWLHSELVRVASDPNAPPSLIVSALRQWGTRALVNDTINVNGTKNALPVAVSALLQRNLDNTKICNDVFGAVKHLCEIDVPHDRPLETPPQLTWRLAVLHHLLNRFLPDNRWVLALGQQATAEASSQHRTSNARRLKKVAQLNKRVWKLMYDWCISPWCGAHWVQTAQTNTADDNVEDQIECWEVFRQVSEVLTLRHMCGKVASRGGDRVEVPLPVREYCSGRPKLLLPVLRQLNLWQNNCIGTQTATGSGTPSPSFLKMPPNYSVVHVNSLPGVQTVRKVLHLDHDEDSRALVVGIDCEWRHPRPVSLVQIACGRQCFLLDFVPAGAAVSCSLTEEFATSNAAVRVALRHVVLDLLRSEHIVKIGFQFMNDLRQIALEVSSHEYGCVCP